MKLQIKKLTIPQNKRLIVMSDLHGEITLFKKALKQVAFSSEDICILVGDCCEKGENSLALVRYIMELQKEYDIHCVMGNCDTLFEDIYGDDDENDEQLKQYLLFRKKSILNEMCEESHIEVHEKMNIAEMKKKLRLIYQKELDFLAQLPHIIETNDYIFVHAGITSDNLENQDPVTCLTMPAFMNHDITFEKTVIVGHWPVCNYHQNLACNNIRIDTKKNIIGIDGGNTIKLGGQINVLMIQDGEISATFVDQFACIEAIEEQKGEQQGLNLCYPFTECEILEENEEECVCLFKAYQMTLTVKKEKMYQRNQKWYCYDQVIHDLPIQKGDRLSIIVEEENRVFVKKEGICGWYHGKYHKIEGEEYEVSNS